MGASPPFTSSSTNSMATSDSRTGGFLGPRLSSSRYVASLTSVGTIPSGLCFMSSGALKWYQFSCSVANEAPFSCDAPVAFRFSHPSASIHSYVRWSPWCSSASVARCANGQNHADM